MVQCRTYLMDLLGGLEKKISKGEKDEREEDEEESITGEEISKVLGLMKDSKAPGIDEIPNEVWKYGGIN